MMPKSRRNTTKRSSTGTWTKTSSSTSTSSDDADFNFQMGLLFRVAMASMNPGRPKRPARRARQTPSKKTKNNSTIVCLDDSDDDIVDIDGANSKNIKENIKGKVDTFFKSGGLISDDEDELQSFRPVKSNEPSCSKSDDLLDVGSTNVIELNDDSTQINSIATEFCKETAHILENANALLDKLTKTSDGISSSLSKESTSHPEAKEQEKRLRECPVCYENLAEKTIMSTKCGHLFCKQCIEKVAAALKKCPICMKAVNKKNIIPIYI